MWGGGGRRSRGGGAGPGQGKGRGQISSPLLPSLSGHTGQACSHTRTCSSSTQHTHQVQRGEEGGHITCDSRVGGVEGNLLIFFSLSVVVSWGIEMHFFFRIVITSSGAGGRNTLLVCVCERKDADADAISSSSLLQRRWGWGGHLCSAQAKGTI